MIECLTLYFLQMYLKEELSTKLGTQSSQPATISDLPADGDAS